MASLSIEGVIEAVRYTPDGEISLVRAYRRHGAVWSDHILLSRTELVEQLGQGKHIVTGTRRGSLGGVFETGPAVRWIDGHIFTEAWSAQRDLLAGVPVF